MKKLCVMSDVIGNHDAIHNGENGFVCDEIEKYKTAILSWHESQEYIDRAYMDVFEKYNTEMMVKCYIKLYLTQIDWGVQHDAIIYCCL